MSDQLLRSAKQEETRLAYELEKTALYRQLMAVRQVIAVYEPAVGETSETEIGRSSSRQAASRATTRPGSQTATVINAAVDFLRERRSRAETGTILKGLLARGVVFTSANPQGSLSSALSHNDLFDNVRGQGYGLIEWSNGADTVPEVVEPLKLHATPDINEADKKEAAP